MRRTEVADAVVRIIARDGLAAVTASAVAAEVRRPAEWAVRHAAAEELLLRLTLTNTVDAVDRRIAAARHETGLLGALAGQPVPDLAVHRPWLGLLVRSAAGPDLADPVRRRFGALHRDLRTRAVATGPVPGTEARAASALVDGLAAHVLIGACPPREAAETLAAHLHR
ncbi:TetR family transcriptional regulator C-terminal domain-containing protein [Amycolatopsis sp. NPDC049691]|uniref:TetR family transcriptional regulator C-terminal domain-containing protein n=1 Tax=Amycolatopsis sp. NPDC049691 TaxID=3155155 RepID=UPI00342E6B03